jgi:hypothetical protein
MSARTALVALFGWIMSVLTIAAVARQTPDAIGVITIDCMILAWLLSRPAIYILRENQRARK